MASREAINLIERLRFLLNERQYERGKASWRLRYTAADLAHLIDEHASQFHAQRLSDAGFELVRKKGKAA